MKYTLLQPLLRGINLTPSSCLARKAKIKADFYRTSFILSLMKTILDTDRLKTKSEIPEDSSNNQSCDADLLT